jgi:hypothetical protein
VGAATDLAVDAAVAGSGVSSYLRIGCVRISTAAHWRAYWNPGGSASPDRFFTIRVVVSSQHRCERSSISPARFQHEQLSFRANS